MRHMIIVAALALSACAGMSWTDKALTGASVAATTADAVGVPPPATAANKTVLDEKLMTGAEALYKGWRSTVESMVDKGQLRGTKAAKAKALDTTAYNALGVVRDAYRTGNATSYYSALANASQAVTDGLKLINGGGN